MIKITNKHTIEEQVKQRPKGAVLVVFKKTPMCNELIQLAESYGVPVKFSKTPIHPDEAERGYYLQINDHQTTERPWNELLVELEAKGKSLVLILDGLEDPQNFGAILRSADQFSVDAVITPQRRSVSLSPGAMAASSGAHLWVPRSTVPNLVRALQDLKKIGFWIYGADMGGIPLHQTKFAPKTALVMGSEGRGLGRLVQETCDEVLSIPTTGHIDSLNVSVATGIFLYAIRTQV